MKFEPKNVRSSNADDSELREQFLRNGWLKPKGSGKTPRQRKNAPEAEALAASLVIDQGKSYKDAAAEAGIVGTEQVMKTAVAREEGRRQGAAETVAVESLSMTAQQKLEAAIRQRLREQDVTFEQRVLKEARSRIESTILPHYNAKYAEAQRLIKSRRGIMSSATFKLIWTCLHSDSRNSVSEKKLNEAFNAFEAVKLLLCDEKQMPTSDFALPRTYDEMMRRKREVSEARRNKRTRA